MESILLPLSVSACHLYCLCRDGSVSTFKCSYWMCKHLVIKTLSGLLVFSSKYDRLRPERLGFFNLSINSIYLSKLKVRTHRGVWRGPQNWQCFIVSLDKCQCFTRGRAAVCWIHISISNCSVFCLHQFPPLHSMVHFRIVVLYKVITGGKSQFNLQMFLCLYKHQAQTTVSATGSKMKTISHLV